MAAQWHRLLEDDGDIVDPETVRAAYAQPRLRQLFPGVSHGVVFFSRCTGSPAAQVGGQVYPRHEGRIRVRGPLGVGTLGEVDTLDEAFALVVGSLPEGCGPAVPGDANEVRRRQGG
ncbi:DUF6193 family natural product biosynthesis protein [Streptomyces sp. TLI_105]|uniref:DUF6193 family natural product biosynthesis protein n=1 Tax=Streptomyces sp. TLI_105 TaxID=1881019 RepID=UPI000898B1BE|nr:DUF6193 family natural product biosynthesis protein [Streptomyces sp. TLI_105]SED79532.1 hypothetical protein SAMN05428939_6272 [Streptomyces sp. TLI_105]